MAWRQIENFILSILERKKVKVAQLCSSWNFPGRNTEVVAFPFSRGSSHPTDWTQVFRIAGRFFTSWATRKLSILRWLFLLCFLYFFIFCGFFWLVGWLVGIGMEIGFCFFFLFFFNISFIFCFIFRACIFFRKHFWYWGAFYGMSWHLAAFFF